VAKEATKAALARAYSNGDEPRYISVAPNGHDEMWGIGGMAFLVPIVPNDAPPELEFALRTRRNALLTGTCPECSAMVGTAFELTIENVNVAGTLIPHRRNCPAADHLVLPQLEQYWTAKRSESLSASLAAASKRTKQAIEHQIPDRTSLPKEKFEVWAQALLDRKSNGTVVTMCDHLRVSPAQTWNMLLGLDNWHCDECWTHLQYSIANEGFRLPMVDDFTCDYCSRYVADLQPLVVRISQFVLRGGLCRRCTEESGSSSNENPLGAASV
jgi:hypothetical protein